MVDAPTRRRRAASASVNIEWRMVLTGVMASTNEERGERSAGLRVMVMMMMDGERGEKGREGGERREEKEESERDSHTPVREWRRDEKR